jgi:glycine oxidase
VTVKESVVVVGAGIIGCAIARELAARGVACTVVDDRGVAGGATQASAGMLAPYVEAHERGPLLELGVRSLDLYPAWIAAIRREARMDVEFATIGTLEVATTEERAAALRAASGDHGQWLDADHLRRGYPVIAGALGGRLTAEHGYVVPPQLANALSQAAEGRGADFLAARVERVTRLRDRFRVETSSTTLEGGRVVIAAGAWAGGIEGLRMPPIQPIRGQIVQLAWPHQRLTSIVWGPRCYVVPRLDHTVLVGATAERVGYDERTTATGVRDLLDAACELLPDARGASFLAARAGLRPATPDELPALGEDPAEPGVVYALGHYRNGVLLAPITAKLIADLVADGRRDPALASFRVDRFRTQSA